MISADKMKTIRAKYEKSVLKLFDKFDPSGYNTAKYKKIFANMSDKEFIETAVNMLKQDDFVFSLDIDGINNNIDLHKIKAIADEYNVKLTEYVFMPFRNPEGEPMCTLTRVPVLFCQVRRFFQQILQHKNSISNNNHKMNPTTGQVTGKDKTASTTNIQTYALTIMNQKNTLKELLGPRADDDISKKQMLNQIEKDGNYRMSDHPIRTENKQAIRTAEAFAKAAGIQLSFARRNNQAYIDKGIESTDDNQFTEEELEMIFSDSYDEEDLNIE